MNTDVNSTLPYQTKLLTHIFIEKSDTQDSGLRVYRNNLYMTATRSLSISYPVIYKMVGKQAQYVLAKRLLDREIPKTGDWADWGRGLTNIIKESELHEDHPYLCQMAELEWAFLSASRSKTNQLHIESLKLLEDENVERVRIILQSSLSLISSSFPLYGLWQLHRGGDKEQLPKKDEMIDAFNSNESGYYLIWQAVTGPKIIEITKEHFDWVNSILNGKKIGELLDTFPDFNFSSWLSDSITNGWLVSLDK
ncbi:putative DNA-binding domain-containing protein [Vibrio cyclitrophicus]|uniref:HvfC/BufC family peptide modification chaperone n=1 Tax=Vibrio cyclitrophicus TaxID=47951 RepID=UPI00029A716E|nr:putative DNA-binding domain-containing protein [Vibrio cyclitrophicus]OEE24287.1 hypothetical protein OAM_17115 [Vibrio cyclitrophicus ZF14]